MANLLTLSRLLLLPFAAGLFYAHDPAWQLFNVFLILLIFLSDGLDGYVARKRNETSLFGALFDIAGDRAVELTLWIVAADNRLIPIWVPLVFIIRGSIVDAIRAGASSSEGTAPFAIMRSRLGKALVAGKGVRVFYAVIKAVAFCGLALVQALPGILPEAAGTWTAMTYVAVYIAVALCILRGVPVVAEFAYAERDSFKIRRRPQA